MNVRVGTRRERERRTQYGCAPGKYSGKAWNTYLRARGAETTLREHTGRDSLAGDVDRGIPYLCSASSPPHASELGSNCITGKSTVFAARPLPLVQAAS